MQVLKSLVFIITLALLDLLFRYDHVSGKDLTSSVRSWRSALPLIKIGCNHQGSERAALCGDVFI